MAKYQEIHEIELISRPSTPKSLLSYSDVAPDGLGRYDSILEPTNESRTNLVLPAPEPEPEPEPKRSLRRYSLLQSIGLIGALVLVLGTLVIIASCGVLIFLWVGAELAAKRKGPELWSEIVFDGWAPRTVTVCSAAMRTAMTFQLGVVVAALAAIMLETSGVRYKYIPMVSTERALLSSPTNILLAVLRGAKCGCSGLLHSLIIITAVIVMLFSSLISTVLISDFSLQQIAAPGTNSTLNMTFSDSDKFFGDNGVAYWKSKPGTWRFAEAQVGEPSFNDTGDTYRAMLPFSNESFRTSLEIYSGPAMVINTRTICKPLPLDDFSLESPPKEPESKRPPRDGNLAGRQVSLKNGYVFRHCVRLHYATEDLHFPHV